MPESATEPRKVEITISLGTIFKILLAIVIATLGMRLWPFAELLLLALLIALAFRPLMLWVERHGWPKWVGLTISGLLLFGFVISLVLLIVPTLAHQTATLVRNLPAAKDQALQHLPSTGPIHDLAQGFFGSPAFTNPEPLLKQVMLWGPTVLEAITGFFLVLIVSLYFMADGHRIYEWLLALLPQRHRRKVGQAVPEIGSVVSHYMIGQLITSIICGGFAFAVLAILKVPSALLLAVMAAVFDVLPMIGFFLFTIPAVLMAWTVSAPTAAIVAALYVAYHVVENYFIVPKVYGDRLRLSTLTVLISCLAAGIVAGVIGIIIILPVVASYPVVERLWLHPYLQPDTVDKHEEIDQREEGDADETRPTQAGRGPGGT
jgi:predicted PurR-regulated permease PerM